MASQLNSADSAAIAALSRTEIEKTTSGLRPFLKRSIWIGTTNHYAKGVTKRLKKGLPANKIQERNLAQYIAASVSLHASDGWSYLGRAVACLMAGDAHRALHLGYYAELRAAMSLLASAGIGVFDRKHFVIPTANAARKLNCRDGTHQAAWLTLERWSQQPASGTLFANVVRPEGRTLEDWFQPEGGAAALAPQAKSWFMQWGMDLGLAVKDRDARNESSYRPDGLPTTWQLASSDCLDFVVDTWRALEPSSTSSFEQVDRHILRLALERHFLGRAGRTATPTDSAYVTLVNSIVEAQSLSTLTADRLRKFLLRQELPTDPSIFELSAAAPASLQTDAFSILSRAVLLLRVATGSAHDLLRQSGFSASELSFWWQKLGDARGLWEASAPPGVLSDLWADVEETLTEVATIGGANPAARSAHSVAFGMNGLLNVLSSHERVALWGLCPE